MSDSSFEEITKTEPEKSLTEPLKKSGGRNVKGRITRRHQGGGHKRQYRQIDFKRVKDWGPAKVAAIEYDPNRSAPIAHPHHTGGAKANILAPARARLGDEPGRPPSRRRRGQVEGRAPSGDALGRPHARQAHAPQAQGIRQVDRPSKTEGQR